MDATYLGLPAAVIVALIVPAIAARAWNSFRKLEYQRHEGVHVGHPSQIAQADPPQFAPIRDLLLQDHGLASSAQSQYQESVARAAASLLLAFAATAAASTFAPGKNIKILLASLDFVAIATAGAYFWTGRNRLQIWIEQRTVAELLRQSTYLRLFFPNWRDAPTRDVTSWYLARRAAVASCLQDRSHGATLEVRVRNYWSALETTLSAEQSVRANDLEQSLVNFYAVRRAERQARWFAASAERLLHRNHSRARVLFFMYLGTVALAAGKVVITTFGANYNGLAVLGPWISFLLLMATGGAAALTAIYLSQNDRALIGQYQALAERARTTVSVLRLLTAPDSTDDGDVAKDARIAVLDFEKALVDELILWIAATTRDSLEVSP